jgi:hypothetical protein
MMVNHDMTLESQSFWNLHTDLTEVKYLLMQWSASSFMVIQRKTVMRLDTTQCNRHDSLNARELP